MCAGGCRWASRALMKRYPTTGRLPLPLGGVALLVIGAVLLLAGLAVSVLDGGTGVRVIGVAVLVQVCSVALFWRAERRASRLEAVVTTRRRFTDSGDRARSLTR